MEGRVSKFSYGYIPACAGEAGRLRARIPGRGVHPRVCGGSTQPVESHALLTGTSPRVRGKHVQKFKADLNARYIPACAGEAIPRAAAPNDKAVHPRVCGGSDTARLRSAAVWGTSPRVRGKPPPRSALVQSWGYIPACAGEAEVDEAGEDGVRVHPRVCGGSPGLPIEPVPPEGTSPRVRGKRRPSPRQNSPSRYIPACAGEAAEIAARFHNVKVHPRVCGGSQGRGDGDRGGEGTSPRVRGKPGRISRGRRVSGYIPACAGEAARCRGGSRSPKVHPRVCGGSAESYYCRHWA